MKISVSRSRRERCSSCFIRWERSPPRSRASRGSFRAPTPEGRPAARRRVASEWHKGSNDGKSGALEHFGERDQRQADEGGRIVGLEARDERDAESFGLRAAGAV